MRPENDQTRARPAAGIREERTALWVGYHIIEEQHGTDYCRRSTAAWEGRFSGASIGIYYVSNTAPDGYSARKEPSENRPLGVPPLKSAIPLPAGRQNRLDSVF